MKMKKGNLALNCLGTEMISQLQVYGQGSFVPGEQLQAPRSLQL